MNIVEEIKLDEGFVGVQYDDSLGIPTIGFGTRLPLSQDEAEMLLKHRLQDKVASIVKEKPIIAQLSEPRQKVIANMVYQMGVGGVLKFKNMWAAIEREDYEKAAFEMLQSRWYKQTPNRAKKLSEIMRG